MSSSCSCNSVKETTQISSCGSTLAQEMITSPVWVYGYEFVMSYANDRITQKRVVGAIILIISFLRLMSLQKKRPLFRVRGYPVIGNLLSFLPGRDALKNVTKMVKKHGNLLELSIFRHRIIVVADVAIAKECLVKRPKTFRRAAALEIPAGLFGLGKKSGVFFAEGNSWARQRRLTAPAFSHKNVGLMSDAISKEIDCFIGRLKALKAGEVVPIETQILFFTIGVITSVAFGDMPAESRSYFQSAELSQDIGSIFIYMVERSFFPLPDFMWRFSNKYYTQSKAAEADKRFSAECLSHIGSARHAAPTATVTDADPDATQGDEGDTGAAVSSRKSLLENLMGTQTGAEKPLTDSEILSNLKIFYLAGSDTTSVVLTWCIYNLCTNEEVLKTVQEEVDSVLRVNVTGAEAVAAVPLLPYCTACFNESLRLQSPVESLILSVAGYDSITLSNGVEVHPRDEVFVHVDSILHDPTIFPAPEVFLPSRWSAEPSNKEKRNEMEDSFLAFGYGPRVCPGQALAHAEGVAALAALIRSFTFTLACPKSEIERVTDFVTKANKMPVFLTPRK